MLAIGFMAGRYTKLSAIMRDARDIKESTTETIKTATKAVRAHVVPSQRPRVISPTLQKRDDLSELENINL